MTNWMEASLESPSSSPLADVEQPLLEEGALPFRGAFKRNRLGILNGVIVPCLLSILGVILFLRLGWAVGEAGLYGVLGVFLLAETQAILTVLSLSALVSNGKMAGGGPYFLISRALGPEIGGAIGVLFYCAYVVGAAFYTIGCATEIVSTFFVDDVTSRWLLTIMSSLILFVILVISLVGARFFTNINSLLFLAQFGAMLLALFSMWFSSPRALEHGGYFQGVSSATFRSNLYPSYTESEQCKGHMCSFKRVFAIVFPAVTGIMEGANLSGDLATPEKSISKGTLTAILISIVSYISLIFSMAGTFPRTTLQTNDVCFSPTLVTVGVLLACSSSALGAIFGGSRVLHALANDNVFPSLGVLVPDVRTAEPRRAVLMTWLLAQACVLLGDLDTVAPIITSFFCLSYAAVNISLVLLKVSGAPNFRPMFSFYSWRFSLFGAVLNLSVMLWLNIWYGAVALLCLIGIFVYLLYSKPQVYWGGVSQALLYHQVRKCLLMLDERKEHAKLWRPSLLLMVDDIDSPLLEFCNHLKKGGLYVLGCVVVGSLAERRRVCEETRLQLLGTIESRKLKAIAEVSSSPKARLGYQSLLQLSGVGVLTPNTVVLALPATAAQPTQGTQGTQGTHGSWHVPKADEVGALMQDALLMNKNVLVAANFRRLSTRPTRIDVWIMGEESAATWAPLNSTPLLLLHLAQILVSGRTWRTARIHVQRLLWRAEKHANVDDEEIERVEVQHFVERSRIRVESINVVSAIVESNADVDTNAQISQMNGIIRDACDLDGVEFCDRVIFMAIPHVSHSTKQGFECVASLNTLTKELPPIAMIASAGQSVMSHDI